MNTGQVEQQGPGQLGGGDPASQHSAREFGGAQIGQGGTSMSPSMQIGGRSVAAEATVPHGPQVGGHAYQGRQSYMPRYDRTSLAAEAPSDGDGEFMEGWPSLTRELPGHDAHEELYDPEYQQWRTEQLRRFDEDYRRWRQERFSRFLEEFKQWRQRRGGSSGPSTPST